MNVNGYGYVKETKVKDIIYNEKAFEMNYKILTEHLARVGCNIELAWKGEDVSKGPERLLLLHESFSRYLNCMGSILEIIIISGSSTDVFHTLNKEIFRNMSKLGLDAISVIEEDLKGDLN